MESPEPVTRRKLDITRSGTVIRISYECTAPCRVRVARIAWTPSAAYRALCEAIKETLAGVPCPHCESLTNLSCGPAPFT